MCWEQRFILMHAEMIARDAGWACECPGLTPYNCAQQGNGQVNTAQSYEHSDIPRFWHSDRLMLYSYLWGWLKRIQSSSFTSATGQCRPRCRLAGAAAFSQHSMRDTVVVTHRHQPKSTYQRCTSERFASDVQTFWLLRQLYRYRDWCANKSDSCSLVLYQLSIM